MKKENRNKVISIFFATLICGAISAAIIVPDKYYSASEKRKLTRLEDLKTEEYASGKFQKRLDEYLNDQFPGRDEWVAAKVFADLAVGKKEINGVYFAKDDYLIPRFTSYDRDILTHNITALRRFAAEASELNVPFSFLPVPSAAYILRDKLPPFAPNIDQQEMINDLKKELNVVDVTDALTRRKNEYIYYRNDHHFTSVGAYYCYAEYRKSRRLPVLPLNEYKREVLSDNFKGTSYAKVNYPFAKDDEIIAYYTHPHRFVSYNNGAYRADSIYERKYLQGKDQYAVFLNSNQAETVIQGDGKEGKLLLIKDSYGNSFAQFPLADYAEVRLLDLRFFRGKVADYIKENDISEVLAIYGIPNFSTDVKLPA